MSHGQNDSRPKRLNAGTTHLVRLTPSVRLKLHKPKRWVVGLGDGAG